MATSVREHSIKGWSTEQHKGDTGGRNDYSHNSGRTVVNHVERRKDQIQYRGKEDGSRGYAKRNIHDFLRPHRDACCVILSPRPCPPRGRVGEIIGKAK